MENIANRRKTSKGWLVGWLVRRNINLYWVICAEVISTNNICNYIPCTYLPSPQKEQDMTQGYF